jgi:hypothetical protein
MAGTREIVKSALPPGTDIVSQTGQVGEMPSADLRNDDGVYPSLNIGA